MQAFVSLDLGERVNYAAEASWRAEAQMTLAGLSPDEERGNERGHFAAEGLRNSM